MTLVVVLADVPNIKGHLCGRQIAPSMKRCAKAQI